MDTPAKVEQVGPQARIQSELVRLETQKREFWVLISFAGVVLILGIVSFFFPHSFWESNLLHVSLSPQVLFVIMVVAVLLVLVHVQRDLEAKALRLANLQQLMTAQAEQAASMVDAVTNVFTRGFLHDLLAGEVARAERSNRSLALLMCDLNNFKQINDRLGHLTGDYVLSQVAGTLKSCVRGSDYVVRYGGDEFLLLLPETDEQGGEIVRRRIRNRLAAWDQKNRIGDLPISLSMGLYLHVNGQSPDKDVAEADARMYIEKTTSRGLRSAPASENPSSS